MMSSFPPHAEKWGEEPGYEANGEFNQAFFCFSITNDKYRIEGLGTRVLLTWLHRTKMYGGSYV